MVWPMPAPPKLPPGENELPYDFGPPMESENHLAQMNLCIDVLRLYLAQLGRTDIYVAGNMALYFNEMQVRHNDFLGPDVFVVLDTIQRPRKSWVVWEEGATPDIVIELLSESTESRDRNEKMKAYARALKVGEYYLFDPVDGRFEGYHLAPKMERFIRIEPDANGDLPCAQLGLKLGVRPGLLSGEVVPKLRWLTPEGEVLPSPTELAEAETRRAEAETRRADSAELRAQRLAERLRALGETTD